MNTIKIKHRRSIYIQIIMFLALLGTATTANAQLNEFQSMYFQNKYLINPAMAGADKGLILNLGYQGQFDPVPGNPKLMSATGEYNAGNRVGLGLNFGSNQAGLITNTRVVGTFAYHLPIGPEDQKLHFGVSVGGTFASIDYNKVSGNVNDPTLQNFNEGGRLDGDFGIAYTDKLWTIQASLPNLNQHIGDDNNYSARQYIDRSVFYSAISYKIYVSDRINDFNLEPIVAYRGINGFKDIFDAGARFNMPEYHMNVSALYHTNETIAAAIGVTVDKLNIFLATANYIGRKGVYANNTFEIGLSYNFLE
jgi:type IX secretion system PorP/SprF family membrane protein